MRPLRNIALTVHELQAGQFFWVLLEGTDQVVDAALAYEPLESATQPQGSYANALVAGVAAMRRLFGPEGPRRGEDAEPEGDAASEGETVPDDLD